MSIDVGEEKPWLIKPKPSCEVLDCARNSSLLWDFPPRGSPVGTSVLHFSPISLKAFFIYSSSCLFLIFPSPSNIHLCFE